MPTERTAAPRLPRPASAFEELLGAQAPAQPGRQGEAATSLRGGPPGEATPDAERKLPSRRATPVAPPLGGSAATPSGWLGPEAGQFAMTPSRAPAPVAARIAAPPNGASATPSGWRGPEAGAPVAAAAAPTAAPVRAPMRKAPPVTTPQTTTPLHRAPAAVETLLQLAHERGISRARINVRPAELGGIEVRLHGTAAHLVADSPEVADALRRNLGQRDGNALSLEVSTTAGDRRAASVGSRSASAEKPAAASTLELPGGLLVDVLAQEDAGA